MFVSILKWKSKLDSYLVNNKQACYLHIISYTCNGEKVQYGKSFLELSQARVFIRSNEKGELVKHSQSI